MLPQLSDSGRTMLVARIRTTRAAPTMISVPPSPTSASRAVTGTLAGGLAAVVVEEAVSTGGLLCEVEDVSGRFTVSGLSGGSGGGEEVFFVDLLHGEDVDRFAGDVEGENPVTGLLEFGVLG